MTAHFATETRKRRVHLLVLALLIIGSLGTIAPSAGALVAAQPLCLDETVWSEEAGECVPLEEEQPVAETPPTETPIPTEIPAPTATSAAVEDAKPAAETPATEIPAPAETGAATATADDDGDLRVEETPVAGFTMFSFGCPSGFDPRTADRDIRITTCGTFVGDVLFSLTVDGEVFGSATSPEGAGGATFASVPPGDFAVSQSVPPGYSGPAAIACQRSGASPGSETKYTFANDGGSFVLLDVQPGSTWYCASYLVAKPNAEIMAYVFGCPENYDIYTKSPEALKSDCTGQFEGTEFVLEHPTDGISHAYTSSFSIASFVNVSPGQVRLKEGMPNGYGVPVVFCQVRGPEGQTTEQYDNYNVSNNASIGLGMDELEFVACDFFQALGGRPVVDATLQDQGFPAQLDPATANVEAVASPEVQALPLGTPTAEQAVDAVTGLQDQGFPAQLDPATANLGIAPGSSFVHIWKLACPEGFAASGADLSVLFFNCRQSQADVGFVVSSNNDTVGATTTEATTGFAIILDVPAGDVVVAEALPLGFGAPVVICRIVEHLSGEIIQEETLYAATANGSITVPGVQAGQGVYCVWFNVPTDANGAIDVVAWSCPEGYDIYTKGPDELIGDCGQKLGDVEFQLQHPTGGISTQLTAGLRSTAYFRNIPPGQVTLKESMPNGYGIPVVFCEARGLGGQTIDQYDKYNVSNNASVQLGMDALDRFTCDFFQALGGQPVVDVTLQDQGFPAQLDPATANVEAVASPEVQALPLGTPLAEQAEAEIPDDTPGAVTIVTYECPISFAAYTASASDINLTCETVRGEAVFEFSLIDGAGALNIQHTGLTDPYLEFIDVAPGAISITGYLPNGFGEPVVYCQVVGAAGEAPTPYEKLPLASPNTIEHTLNASEQLACDWFNVPIASPFDNAQSEVVSE